MIIAHFTLQLSLFHYGTEQIAFNFRWGGIVTGENRMNTFFLNPHLNFLCF